MSETHASDTKFWVGFFIGGFLGALTLFFLGTKEGKKAGVALQKRGMSVFDEMMARVDELEAKGRELVSEGEKLKDTMVEELEAKREELTDDVSQKLDNALEHVETIQEQGLSTTASIRKRFFKNVPRKS